MQMQFTTVTVAEPKQVFSTAVSRMIVVETDSNDFWSDATRFAFFNSIEKTVHYFNPSGYVSWDNLHSVLHRCRDMRPGEQITIAA
jgi:hypothetical protein